MAYTNSESNFYKNEEFTKRLLKKKKYPKLSNQFPKNKYGGSSEGITEELTWKNLQKNNRIYFLKNSTWNSHISWCQVQGALLTFTVCFRGFLGGLTGFSMIFRGFEGVSRPYKRLKTVLESFRICQVLYKFLGGFLGIAVVFLSVTSNFKTVQEVSQAFEVSFRGFSWEIQRYFKER